MAFTYERDQDISLIQTFANMNSSNLQGHKLSIKYPYFAKTVKLSARKNFYS